MSGSTNLTFSKCEATASVYNPGMASQSFCSRFAELKKVDSIYINSSDGGSSFSSIRKSRLHLKDLL